MENAPEARVSARISKRLLADIEKIKKNAGKKNGYEPKLGSVIRSLLEDAVYGKGKKK